MARRSARLSKAFDQQRSPDQSRPPAAPRLGSVLEQDECEDTTQPESINYVLNAPASTVAVKSQFEKLNSIKTPKTEPRPSRAEMHPKTVHPITASPDSGFKLGFVDVSDKGRRSIATIQDTPSRSRENLSKTAPAPAFHFTFGTESNLSHEARQLMEQVREEAAKIKTQMAAEKDAQDQQDGEAERMFNGINTSGRKIAKPKAKAGRFSDIHMAQFKKMDSIANHPSSFRGKRAYTQPTAQSLKRSGSKAGLDEPERPRTAGKGTPVQMPPPFSGRPTSASPFKSIPTTDRLENTSSAKRMRRSQVDDVSTSRPANLLQPPRPSAIPKSSTLFSPTKSSLARSSTGGALATNKLTMIPRSNSVRSLGPTPKSNRPRPSASLSRFTSKLLEARQEAQERAARGKPLPALPPASSSALNRSVSISAPPATPILATPSKPSTFSSKLPTFSGLKSILRSTRKASNTERPITPKRPNTEIAGGEFAKKVDFTPSVKSRYAVKLAASSPSPAKLARDEVKVLRSGPLAPYDPAAYTMEDDGDETWEDASSSVDYPTLPSEPTERPNRDTLMQKASDQTRRESKEFKSIFTTLHPLAKTTSPSTLTSVNTTLNKTNPTAHANKTMRSPLSLSTKPSPSTIRRVRTSGVTSLIQPFEDTSVPTLPHGLPGKKRRRSSTISDDLHGTDKNAKENRRMTLNPSVPGGWNDPFIDEDDADADDEGRCRGGKKARAINLDPDFKKSEQKSPVKKSAAREQAAKSAKDRKGKGIGGLTMSRLNTLSRPKTRG